MIRFLSVCSGIEAASQALHRHGFECAAVSEIEPHPCAVLAHRFGASRPLNMPHPDDVPTHDAEGNPRAPKLIEKERKARAAAIKAMLGIPSGNQIPNFGDMSRFQEWPDADYDALFGGTPCQSFSVAGLRQGLDDPRGNLMLTFGAIAARYRPRWLCWENVPGVLSSEGGRDFASLLGLLTGQQIDVPEGGWQNSGIVPGIADAYGIAYRVLDAQYVRTRRHRRAVPQRRRRVFLIGYIGDWRRAAAVLFDAESLRRDPPPRRSAGQGTAADTLRRTDGGSDVDHARAHHLVAAAVTTSLDASMGRLQGASGQDANHGHSTLIAMSSGQAIAEITDGHSPALTCLHEAPIIAQEVAPTLRDRGFDATDDGTGKGTPIIPVAHPLTADMAASANRMPQEQGALIPVAFNSREDPEVTGDRAGPLGSSLPQAQAVAYDMRGREGGAQLEGPHDTANLRAADGGSSRSYADGGSSRSYVALPWAVRRLTPVECERLMGMEDGFTNIPWRGKDFSPDGNRYKELGNSWALNSIDWIGERMAIVDGWDL